MSEIVNTIINGTDAIGNVNIEVYRGSKKVRTVNGHNTGTLELCKYLRDALTGENVAANRPGRIIPCKTVNNALKNMFEYGVQYLPESIGNKTDSGDIEDAFACISLGFIIPNNLLERDTPITGFRLYRNILDSRGRLVKYAEIDFQKQGIEPIVITDNNTSLRVDWTIKIAISRGV